MAYKGLDEYLIRLEQARCLTTVRRRFESLEAALAHAASAGRGMRFENVYDSPHPIVTGLFASERQMAWALGLSDLEVLSQRLDRLLDPQLPTQFSDLIARAGDLLGTVRVSTQKSRSSGSTPYEPMDARGIDVRMLPQFQRGEFRSLPGAALFYGAGKDTRVDWVRARVVDANRLEIEALDLPGLSAEPAALVWGSDPAFMWAAGLKLPQQISPLWLAGWLRGKPVPLTGAQTQAIEIPADAELVIEGWLTGAKLQITGGARRAGAVLPVVEKSAASDRARDMVIRAVLRLMWPQVAAVRTINQLLVVTLNTASHEAIRQVIFGVWALRLTAHVPIVLMMDAAADVQDDEQVARAAVRALMRPDYWLTVGGTSRRLALDGRVTASEREVRGALLDDEQPAEVLRTLSNLESLEDRLATGADGRAKLDLRVVTSDL